MATQLSDGPEQVDAYLAELAQPHRATLEAVRATLRSILPHADECMKYGMPAVALNGTGVAGYAAFKDHCGYFPMSSTVLVEAGHAIARYPTSKGGLKFPVDKPLSASLVRKLVKLRLAEMSAVTNGKRYEYYDDGAVKAVGSMKAGELNGAWQWFRRDGSLMRSGKFTSGRQVGTWTSWDADGIAVKTTTF